MTGGQNQIFAKRLQQARKMRGWSLANLRAEMGDLVSVAALSKYEKGLSMPSSGVLIALANALDVSIDYLFREFEVTLERIRFRKLSRMPKREQDRVCEQARDFFERYFELEEVVGEGVRYDPPNTASLGADFEAVAEHLRAKWNVGEDPISNVHVLLENHGIKVWFPQECDEDFDGFSADTERGPVIVVSGKKVAARKRMTALHELAHFLAKPLNLEEREEEKFVRRLTGAILLPKDALRSILGRHRSDLAIGELLEIKKQFGISMSGVIARARETGIISEDRMKRFYYQGPAGKWRSAKKEPYDDELLKLFPESNFRYRQLVFRAYGEEKITLSQAAAYLETSLDEATRMLNLTEAD